MSHSELFDSLRLQLPTLAKTTAKERKAILTHFSNQLMAWRPKFQEALLADLGKAAVETDISEILLVLDEIKVLKKELPYWMRPERAAANLLTIGTSNRLIKQPKGMVLIISPWNYPLQLSLLPLAGALAAGNAVIMKPSEFAPAYSQVLQKFVAATFSPKQVQVVQGDGDTAAALLKLPFNHVFFTGSTRVGKLVMTAAAQHLASVTLELGGKSPVIVDETANLNDTIAKLGNKWLNAGQTCIAPDYVYVHHSKYDALVAGLKQLIIDRFGATEQEQFDSKSLGRIVSTAHAERQQELINDAMAKGGVILFGGQCRISQKFVAPTLIGHISTEMRLMQEEIFGPVMPILSYRSISEPMAYIESGDKPLSCYLFSGSSKLKTDFINATRGGGVVINDTLIHILNTNLPFGGDNQSGIGKYHGIHSLEAFSNTRGVTKQQTFFNVMKLLYPPYGKRQRFLAKLLLWLHR
jgi:aldehyde dehydrogenase (NAD+)